MESIELEHDGLEIKFYETTNDHIKKFGIVYKKIPN
jgi:hypothetical protein